MDFFRSVMSYQQKSNLYELAMHAAKQGDMELYKELIKQLDEGK